MITFLLLCGRKAIVDKIRSGQNWLIERPNTRQQKITNIWWGKKHWQQNNAGPPLATFVCCRRLIRHGIQMVSKVTFLSFFLLVNICIITQPPFEHFFCLWQKNLNKFQFDWPTTTNFVEWQWNFLN